MIDFVYHDSSVKKERLAECLGKINVKEIAPEEKKPGDLIEWNYEGNLHVGFLIESDMIIHATFSGIRITPIILIKNYKIGRVYKW